MTLELFETRTMLVALEEAFPPKTFLIDTFFSKEKNFFPTKHVDIDHVKGIRRLAPYVKSTSEGKVVERIGFDAKSYVPPYIKVKTPTTAQLFLTRDAGQTVYGANDGPEARAQKQLGKDLADLSDMITRREEQQASQLLHTGKVTVVGDGYNDEIDFGMKATHLVTVSAANRWNAGTAYPLEQLRQYKRTGAQDCGLIFDKCIMGTDALDAFLKNTNVVSQLDTRRIDLGQIDPVEESKGVTYYGRIKDCNLDLYTYEEYYVDPDTTVLTPMVAPKQILLGSTQARASMNYGAIEDLDAGANFAVARFPKSWREKDPSVQWLLLQSAPLLALHQVDGFMRVTVLA